jgi:hypothetical protein
MYAYSWFLTYFTNKLDLNIIYAFWELLLKEDD